MISFSHNFIFVHVPKTGGTSIQSILGKYCIDEISYTQTGDNEPQMVLSNMFGISKHSPLFKYKKRIPKAQFKEMKIIAVMRNPWDRLVSMYFSAHKDPKDWEAGAVKKTLKRVYPLTYYLSRISVGKYPDPNPEFYKNVHFLLKFENLEEDFKRLCQKLSIPYEPLPKLNVSKNRQIEYRKYYMPDLREEVQIKYADEIKRGKYVF